MGLPDLSIRRPIATAMFYLGIAVLGVISFTRLPIDLLPDVAFPTLSVWTPYRDAAPPEVERFVTEPIEREVSQIPGVRRVTSRSREGQSLVRLQFYWGTDMEFATLNLRERLEVLRAILPRTSDRPVILRSDPASDPILTLAVSGADPVELRELSKDVFARRLEQQAGVALAALSGGREREIQVLLDPLSSLRETVTEFNPGGHEVSTATIAPMADPSKNESPSASPMISPSTLRRNGPMSKSPSSSRSRRTKLRVLSPLVRALRVSLASVPDPESGVGGSEVSAAARPYIPSSSGSASDTSKTELPGLACWNSLTSLATTSRTSMSYSTLISQASNSSTSSMIRSISNS